VTVLAGITFPQTTTFNVPFPRVSFYFIGYRYDKGARWIQAPCHEAFLVGDELETNA